MSWAAHELENYVIQRHGGLRISFLAVALGAFSPDMLTKGFVYGFTVGPISVEQAAPALFHRSWPGAGFTHSLLFGVVIAVVVLALTRSRGWSLGLLLGNWAHVLTDINDTAGTMLFFPFSLENITTGMWKYAAQAGRYGDAAAYYSSAGGVWDVAWLVIVLVFARHTLTRDYFRRTIVPADPRVWGWLRRRFGLDERGLLALYRGLMFYGTCRIVSWSLYTWLVVRAPWDPSWGGPWFIEPIELSRGEWWEVARSATFGAAMLTLLLAAMWLSFGKRLWDRAQDGTDDQLTPWSAQP